MVIIFLNRPTPASFCLFSFFLKVEYRLTKWCGDQKEKDDWLKDFFNEKSYILYV